jgi:hypothetical protein
MASAEERAQSALTQINNIGFSEFTAKLIGDTVDAVVGATVRQLKSFTELVKELEEGLESFKAKAVTQESLNQYMADAFPAAGGRTAVMAGISYDRNLYQQIVARCGAIDGLAEPAEDATESFTEENVTAVRNASRQVLNRAAEGSYDQLRMLVQMGYARVVFTNGRVKSKLTFEVQTSDSRVRSSSDMAQSSFQASAQMGGILGAILGVSGSTSYRSLHVRTVNERSAEADKVSADILGEVEVSFARWTYKMNELRYRSPDPA